jgi:hypothetical protein
MRGSVKQMENYRPHLTQKGPIRGIPLRRLPREDGKILILHQDGGLVRDSPGIKPLQVTVLPIWPHHAP